MVPFYGCIQCMFNVRTLPFLQCQREFPTVVSIDQHPQRPHSVNVGKTDPSKMHNPAAEFVRCPATSSAVHSEIWPIDYLYDCFITHASLAMAGTLIPTLPSPQAYCWSLDPLCSELAQIRSSIAMYTAPSTSLKSLN